MYCGIRSYNTHSKCSLSVLTQPHNRFATRLLPCRWYVVRRRPRNPLFRCVKSSRYCCYRNHTARSKPI